MRPPRFDTRTSVKLDTVTEFCDKEFGWVRRLHEPCPKCNRDNTMAVLQDQGFRGCTHCLYIQLEDGYSFEGGGYIEARKLLEILFDVRRAETPIQPRFHPMNFKRR